jgi:hypothetical protein
MSGSSHLSIAPAQTNATSDWTELAIRDSDGLEISLLWSKAADSVKVNVFDQRLEESFDIHVAGALALSAFYHPFAHVPEQECLSGNALREAA